MQRKTILRVTGLIATIAMALALTNSALAIRVGPAAPDATISICYQETNDQIYALITETSGAGGDFAVYRYRGHGIVAKQFGKLKADKTTKILVQPRVAPGPPRVRLDLETSSDGGFTYTYKDSVTVQVIQWYRNNGTACPEPKEPKEEKDQPFSWSSYTPVKPPATDSQNYHMAMDNLNVPNAAGQLPCGVFETVYGHVTVNEIDFPTCTWEYHVECMGADGAWMTSTAAFHERNPEGDYSPYSAWKIYQDGACGIFND